MKMEKNDMAKRVITRDIASETFRILSLLSRFETSGRLRRYHISRLSPRFAGHVGKVEVCIDGCLEAVTYMVPPRFRTHPQVKQYICDQIFLNAVRRPHYAR